ncbi:Spy/CpxP family protein refolding chaperone [Ochrobactrum sp. P20RRXII]|nr:hypothetical protein [Ochrobactrum sp. P20RRXII]NIH74464.1 Spy/CpxP family protein refolding chaperone [Ochrobactrum sp. P20RRXII]
MASEDLLKKAVAAFNALSPEQQAEMLEEQRQSWVRGNVGLSRDERDMTSPMMSALKTVREENSIGRQAVKAWADSKTHPTPVAPVSPDATGKCGELVTKAWNCTYPSYGHFTLKEHEAKQAIEDGASVEELVTRSQAVELLAAERAEKEELREALRAVVEARKADNAALTARVKELDLCHEGTIDLCNQKTAGIKALEAKLAAANEKIEEAYRLGHLNGRCGGTGPTEDDDWKEARAALGGKPS